jgi:ParB family transcriptional regulator, chromosome partitioning protein
MANKKGLGKRLGALMSESTEELKESNNYMEIPIHKLERNPDQPRTEFSEDSLNELSESIKEKGILQPLLVRPISDDNYQIIAGERRWRASKLAGLDVVPCIVREFTEDELLVISLIENIQRDELTPIDTAKAYQKLIETQGLTQEQVAKAVKKSREAVANSLRLLKLAPQVVTYLQNRDLYEGAARLLLSIKDHDEQIKVADFAVENSLTVKAISKLIEETCNSSAEQAITLYIDNQNKVANIENQPQDIETQETEQKTQTTHSGEKSKTQKIETKDPDILQLEEDIRTSIGARVEIKQGKGESGSVLIHYSSLDDFERIKDILMQLE